MPLVLLMTGCLAGTPAPDAPLSVQDGVVTVDGGPALETHTLGTRILGAPEPGVECADGACRLTLEREGIEEWWIAAGGGYRHGWTISAPDPLHIGVRLRDVDGVRVQPGTATWRDGTGREWTYTDLRAWDAEGQTLPATLVESDGGFDVVVDAPAGAPRPIHVDPTLTSKWLISHPEGASPTFATDIAILGDIDGDGLADIGVNDRERRLLHVYSGGPPWSTRKDIESPLDREAGFAALSFRGAGDVDGDGYDDVIVGADNAENYQGVVYLLRGGPAGLDIEQSIVLSIEGTQDFGTWLAAVGDINADGFDDIIVGGGYASWLVLGGATQSDLKWHQLASVDRSIDLPFFIAAGDMNADGFADVVECIDSTTDNPLSDVRVHRGSASGLSDGLYSEVDVLACLSMFSADLDADGFSDVVSPAYSGMYVLWGGEQPISVWEFFPVTFAHDAGDFDADGVNDVVAYWDDPDAWGLSTWFGTTARAFATGDVIGHDGACWAEIFRAGELTGDQYDDLLVFCEPDLLVFEGGCRDVDGDAFCVEEDCDDSDESVSPGHPDFCGDGVDNDCDGAGGPDDDEDADGLSWNEEQALGTDPCDGDSDGDGVSDGEDLDPLTADHQPRVCDCGVSGPAGGGAVLLVLGLAITRRRLRRRPQPSVLSW